MHGGWLPLLSRYILSTLGGPRDLSRKHDPAAATPEELARWAAENLKAWEKSAHNIIKSENVLKLFSDEIKKVIAGEEDNAKLLYLVATSRLFDKPMHAAIKGTSSGGKSELRQRVLDFFPPDDVVAFTSMSEKALYFDERGFEHKILSMAEAASVEAESLQDLLLRELMSSGKLTHRMTIKRGNNYESATIEKSGPVAFMVTTTKNSLHPENETRMISIEIDDTEKQTRAVLSKVAQVEGLNRGVAAVDYEPWRDFQRVLGLGERKVVVPFADTLSGLIPAASVRLRRDFGQVLRAIKAHALLHRQHRDRDDMGQVVADIDHDYAEVRHLMNALIAESSGVAVNMAVQETVDAVAEATEHMESDDEGASAQTVALRLNLDKSAARRRLLKSASEGFVMNLETRRGQPGRYRVTGQKPEIVDMLPPAEKLATVPPLAKSQVSTNIKQNGTGGPVAQVARDGDPIGEGDADDGCHAPMPDDGRDTETTGMEGDGYQSDAKPRPSGFCPNQAKPDCCGAAPAEAGAGEGHDRDSGLASASGGEPQAGNPDFEERAAIREYDGGLSREEAEAQAADDLEIPACLWRSA